jgi:hypothetical protein
VFWRWLLFRALMSDASGGISPCMVSSGGCLSQDGTWSFGFSVGGFSLVSFFCPIYLAPHCVYKLVPCMFVTAACLLGLLPMQPPFRCAWIHAYVDPQVTVHRHSCLSCTATLGSLLVVVLPAECCSLFSDCSQKVSARSLAVRDCSGQHGYCTTRVHA